MVFVFVGDCARLSVMFGRVAMVECLTVAPGWSP